MGKFIENLKNTWDTFLGNKDEEVFSYESSDYTPGYNSTNYNYARYTKSIIPSLYTRMAMDVASFEIIHANVDPVEEHFLEERVKSPLDLALTVSANIDQTGRNFIQDVVLTMFENGVAAVVPTTTSADPSKTESYEIYSMRVGTVEQWYPKKVKVRLYDERDGKNKSIVLEKSNTALIENPLYPIMNSDGSIMRKLEDSLRMLSDQDRKNSSNRLDLILQLPYTIRSSSKKREAELRKKSIEDQLSSSEYGIAYIDGTERVTQLNRPVENTLFNQVQYYTSMLYSQLGLSEAVFNGTANEQEMLNYYNRTIEPILSSICGEMTRKFISKTAYSQGQRVIFVNNPFRLSSTTAIAEVADKFTRNEILSSNEIRSIIGFRPSDDPGANELRNKNLNKMKDAEDKKTEEEINEKDGI